MLDRDIITQLKDIFGRQQTPVTLKVTGAFGTEATTQMTEFATDFAEASPQINAVSESAATAEGAPTLEILVNGAATGIRFVGIPNGHEFTSLIMAVLNADGKGKNLPDQTLARRIEAIKGPVDIYTFVSLTCTNCPDVVQALNVIALLNPGISNTTVDGAVAQEMVAHYGVQSVPTVYANGTLLHVGRSDLGELTAKLEQTFGSEQRGETMQDAPSKPLRFDAIVAGGGPAGAAAAIYLARKGMRTAVIAGRIGGQVKDTMDIENLISVPKTTGPALATDLRRHIDCYDVSIFDNRRIAEAHLKQPIKELSTDSGETFETPALIIATGASWRRLNIPGEAEYIGRGVAFCTHCDGPFYAGKRVAVVGGGNSGVEAAIDLATICTHVDLFEFLDELKADKVLQEKLATMPNVEIHLSTALNRIDGDGKKVSSVMATHRHTKAEAIYAVNGVFVQIGLVPNSEPFQSEIVLNSRKEIPVDEFCRTEVPGVYAAGDVTSVPYKQIIVAMGEGAKAALSAVDDRMRGITPTFPLN